jgi:hypothetical protein
MTAVRVRGFSDEAFRRAVAESAPAVLDEPEMETPDPVEPETPDVALPDVAAEADDDQEPATEADTIAARGLKYWTVGQGGTVKIRWNTPGDHGRCERALTGKVADPAAYCAKLHKIMTGVWPGDKRNVGAGEANTTGQPERITVHEADLSAVTATKKPGRLAIRLIRAGWSLNNNYYPAEVLRRDGPSAWPKGTRCYVDHATDEEDAARPAGSVRNLAAVTTSDARWDEAEQALKAEVRLIHPWRETLTDMARAQEEEKVEVFGMSIRAWVTGEHGEHDGRSGFIVQSIPEGRSVDFVTKPAAGGGIVSVLESVGHQVPTAEAANVGAWLESRLHLTLTQLADDMYGDGRLSRDERITLSAAIGDALQAWTARVEQDAPQLFQRDRWTEPPEPQTTSAEEANGSTPDPAPADPPPGETPTEPAPVQPDTTDDVTDGAPPTAPNPPTKEEPAMSGTTTGVPPVEAGTAPVVDTATTTAQPAPAAEAAHPRVDIQALVTAAVTEAVTPLTQQLTTVQQALTAQESENRMLRNRATASEAVAAALRAPEHADVAVQIGPRVTARILDAVPTTAEGVVDGAALNERITAAIADEATYVRQARAEALEAAGVGNPYGLPARAEESTQDDGFEQEMNEFFGALGLNEAQAKIAAKGRN